MRGDLPPLVNVSSFHGAYLCTGTNLPLPLPLPLPSTSQPTKYGTSEPQSKITQILVVMFPACDNLCSGCQNSVVRTFHTGRGYMA
jgi:hypothetical protein